MPSIKAMPPITPAHASVRRTPVLWPRKKPPTQTGLMPWCTSQCSFSDASYLKLGRSCTELYSPRSGYRGRSEDVWKMRVVRKAFDSLGLTPELLHHGFKREIFSCQLATNALEYLRGAHKRPNFRDLMSVEQVSDLCSERWVLPRALSQPDFCDFRPEYLHGVIATGLAWQTARAGVGVLGNQSHD